MFISKIDNNFTTQGCVLMVFWGCVWFFESKLGFIYLMLKSIQATCLTTIHLTKSINKYAFNPCNPIFFFIRNNLLL